MPDGPVQKTTTVPFGKRLRGWRRQWTVAVLASLLPLSLSALPLKSSAAMQKDEDRNARAAADFPKLVEDYLSDLYARHPTAAAAGGLHSWDSLLEDFSAHAISEEVSTIRRF